VTEQQRVRLGVTGIIAGLGALLFGVFMAHFTGLPETNGVGQEIYPHIPRCVGIGLDEDFGCWMLPTLGQSIGFIGSQILMAGLFVGWIWKREMTWARATVAAMLFTVEMLLLFGVVPNEWLALTQGNFEWTSQKVWFTLPKWLVLNNDVSISFGVVKDAVAGGYSAVLLGAIAVGIYQVQERAKKAGAPKPQPVSPFGRPLVKGGNGNG
jgi:hypothetical protein